MAHPINPMVVDLSHYDPADDYNQVKSAGIVGIIYKATQGGSYQDPTYVAQRSEALKAGLKWGCYHFGDNSDVEAQVRNFIDFAKPDADTLICLDFEDNGSKTMSLIQAEDFVSALEVHLDRDCQTVLYSGNLIKERLGNKVDPFWCERRLWLTQYGSSPSVPPTWNTFWLWQYTGDGDGPMPHTIDGCCPDIDISSYDGTPEQLAAEWATGQAEPAPPAPPTPEELVVTITISAPEGVTVNVVQT